jgi:hypothetical protein
MVHSNGIVTGRAYARYPMLLLFTCPPKSVMVTLKEASGGRQGAASWSMTQWSARQQKQTHHFQQSATCTRQTTDTTIQVTEPHTRTLHRPMGHSGGSICRATSDKETGKGCLPHTTDPKQHHATATGHNTSLLKVPVEIQNELVTCIPKLQREIRIR